MAPDTAAGSNAREQLVGGVSLRGKYHLLDGTTTTGLCGERGASLGVRALAQVYIGNVCRDCLRRQEVGR